MEARSFDDPAMFRRAAEPLLLADEGRNNLILGITGTLVTRPEVYPEFHLWLVEESGSPVAAAAMTPPHHLILADPVSEIALRPLVEVVTQSGAAVPGVLGNEPTVSVFVDLWAKVGAGGEAAKTMSHGVFATDRVVEVPQVAGGPRTAGPEDIDLLIDWVSTFQAEADPHAPAERTEISVRSRLQGDETRSGFWIWEVGDPVSISGHGGRTPNGVRIGPVYTPAHHRRHGYATALVATQSAWLLENGHRFCFLYTDLANPTSNSIYTRIGYRRVAEASRFAFWDQPEG